MKNLERMKKEKALSTDKKVLQLIHESIRNLVKRYPNYKEDVR